MREEYSAVTFDSEIKNSENLYHLNNVFIFNQKVVKK